IRWPSRPHRSEPSEDGWSREGRCGIFPWRGRLSRRPPVPTGSWRHLRPEVGAIECADAEIGRVHRRGLDAAAIAEIVSPDRALVAADVTPMSRAFRIKQPDSAMEAIRQLGSDIIH